MFKIYFALVLSWLLKINNKAKNRSLLEEMACLGFTWNISL